ncbi:MAG: type II secretion system F family protein [Candidatus Peribacteraceae bacterium]|nr:type II secretion system F family protein [Candidatus Peribacteraceae bacterium]
MPIEPIPAQARSTSLSVTTAGSSAAAAQNTAGKTDATAGPAAVVTSPEKESAMSAILAKGGQTSVTGFKRFLAGLNNMGMGKEKSQFIENLAILLNSGLSVIDALRTVSSELRNRAMKKVAQRMINEVENGIALWRAMDNQCLFSAYALALIRIGEESGSLSKNMEYLAVQQEKDRSLRSKVKMAMIYPSIVIVLTMIVTLGLAWFVLPQLVGVLVSLNAKLPLPTRIIIWVADFFGDHGAIVVPSIFAGLVVFALLTKYTALKGPVQQTIFKTPGIGTMARSATIASFGVILGSLLRAGVPIVDAVQSLADVTDTVRYRKFYGRLARELEVGQSFSSAFKAIRETTGVLPASVQQLIITGERSGRMADMLLRIADIYEKKAEEAAAKLPVVLEPILLIFIGGLVGTIAFAIIVPIYSVVGSMGNA